MSDRLIPNFALLQLPSSHGLWNGTVEEMETRGEGGTGQMDEGEWKLEAARPACATWNHDHSFSFPLGTQDRTATHSSLFTRTGKSAHGYVTISTSENTGSRATQSDAHYLSSICMRANELFIDGDCLAN